MSLIKYMKVIVLLAEQICSSVSIKQPPPTNQLEKTTVNIQMIENVSRGPHDLITFALTEGVLRFGDFKTKTGRQTPYFFNAGDFYKSLSLAELGDFYAKLLIEKFGDNLSVAVLFGPAYKGIGLVYTVATILGLVYGIKVDVAYNRKEAKDHGEGGTLVGASLKDRLVIILEDVVTTSETKIEAAKMIKDAGGTLLGCVIAFDRQEKGAKDSVMTERSGAQEFEVACNVPMYSIATLADLITYMKTPERSSIWVDRLEKITSYRDKYGIKLED